MYQPLLEEDQVQIHLDLPDAAPIIQGDQARLTQCVSNLLNNACRYTPTGGQISVSLDQANGWIQLSVKDTGIGISPEHLPHIFERFYRVDPARNRATGGTGLGLAITKALVEAHGGKITAVSEGEKQGSDFMIKLPVAPPDPMQENGSKI
jgi:histidine kinase